MKNKEYAQSVVASAKTLVVNEEGKVLLLRRSGTDTHRPLTWDLPGGVIDPGESPEACAVREADEEAGIEVTNLEIIFVKHKPLRKNHLPVLVLIYRGETKNTDIKLSYEHDKYVWIDKSEASDYEAPDYYYDLISKHGQ